MSKTEHTPDRREFIKYTGAAATAFAALNAPRVFASAGANHKLKLALVGCGGRGTGAVVDAMTAAGSTYPLQLVAMADIFPHRLDESFNALQQQFAATPKVLNVQEDKKFIGFDAYKKALDC
ncbi:MAG TPA: twin-arginine translocation signal domain-containing protein, partial [Lacipirellulaceae bacterium]|nr:twin-arginine translocation signal domain-containing protein [Lacipirellulaceae bacterium]